MIGRRARWRANAVREKASQAHDVDVIAVLRRGDGDEVVTAKVYTNAPTSWFIENVPRLLKDKPASAEIDRAIFHCKEMINFCKRL